VRAALAILREGGYVRSLKGSGTVVLKGPEPGGLAFPLVRTIGDIEQYYEFRAALEAETAALAAERHPPASLGAIAAALAEQLTYARSDGTRVAGYARPMDDPSSTVYIIRAPGGDFITRDYRFIADEPPAVAAVTPLRDWFGKGMLPRNVMTFKTEEVITAMQQGRAALTNLPFGRLVNYNHPQQSRFPGEIKVTTLPMMEKTGGRGALVPAKTSVWAMAIPRNSPNKERAWD